jgi:diaminopimelate epimerase
MVSITMRDIESYDLNDERLLINTGSPHYVTRVKDLKNYDVRKHGAEIRNDKRISNDGVNVDFMEVIDNQYHIRTFERGVEDETLACGTGVTASAIAAALWYGGDNINIKTTLATLNVKFEKAGNSIKNIVLSGPATHVFDGFYIFAK